MQVIVPTLMLALAAAIVVFYFISTKKQNSRNNHDHAHGHKHQHKPHSSLAPSPKQSKDGLTPKPSHPAPAPSTPLLQLDDDSPSVEVEVTQMGALPPEVLAAIQGKLSGEIPDAQEIDVELDELVDENAAEEITGASALILVTGFARSDRGLKRKCNEDAFLCLPEEPLFVVADGMGGHQSGDVASSTAVQVLEKVFKDKTFENAGTRGWPRRGDELVCAIEMANRAVWQIAQDRKIEDGMGTTVVAIRFAPNKQRAYIAHVGDSRCYRIRNGALTKLTEDHTLGNLLGIGGKVAKHLARAVGIDKNVAVDLTIEKPAPGDFYLVCSDGLNKMLPDKDIERLFLHTSGELDDKARMLIEEANRRGGRDNVTVIAVGVEIAKFS